MKETNLNKLTAILNYLDTFGENLSQREAKSILSRLREIGIKEINFKEQTILL